MTTTDFDLTHSSSLCNGKDSNGHAVLHQEKYRLQNLSTAYRRHAIALAVGWLPMLAAAQPLGGQVVSGSASISQSGAPGQSVTTVKQNSPVTSIHWKSFNLGTGDTVNFVQPSSQAVAINRISDVAGSKIHGRIQANGQVWLLNPNGILFGKDAQINVGGLLASTLSTMDPTASSPALRQVQVLSASSKAPVVNLGQINATEGGYVALLGHTVSNQGSIKADQGSIALGAGSDLSLQFEGSRLLSVKVNQHQLDALAGNGGLLQADGGRVILTAGARDSVLASAVNNTGVVQARTAQMREGSIVLVAGMKAGQANIAGTLDASAPETGRGGFIETSGARVQIDPSLQLSTSAKDGHAGEWLIDPTDFTVGRGNVEQSSSGMSGDTLSQLLTPLYLKSTANGSKTYDGSVNFSTGSVKDPGALPKLFAGTLTLVLDDPNAGYRQAVASGYYSDQVGYQIVYDFDVNKVLVEKAPLTFTADKASFTIGQTIDGLSGSYKGLVGTETLEAVTNGSLKWKSSVSDTLKPGSFAIEADGLSAGNYEFKQNPSNQTAMTVRPVATPAVIPASTAFNQKPLSYLQPAPANSNSKAGAQDAVASASVESNESGTNGGIYEFCLPKPPSMLSVASATCVRGKQP